MKQIIQDLKKGNTILEEVPRPVLTPNSVLVDTSNSLVSLGTERMLVEFGQAGYLSKARQQPDKVKMVLDKMKTDGILPTVEAVFNKLNQPLPLGYCNVGVVKEVSAEINSLKVGDRVASNGHHAETVCVPENLAVKIPEDVSDEEACFTVIGAIALQGIRLINPSFGETIVVVGLGLIGQITVQLLKANGCKVIGYDFDQRKVDLASSFGIVAFNPGKSVDPVSFVEDQTSGKGADGVIITASAKNDTIVSDSANMCRKRGRIVLVGIANLNLSRADFYEKELSFQVSCSYGPGRYDDDYEQKGNDYPYGFVRWTEKRNFEAVLNAIANGSLDVKSLISERVDLENYLDIYGNMDKSTSIASILTYPKQEKPLLTVTLSEIKHTKSKGTTGIIGAGNFASSTALPILKKKNVDLKYISSLEGLSAVNLAKRFGVQKATSDYKEILNDPEVDQVIILTRHDAHALLVIESLEAGKNVFVEKPLCLKPEELDQIMEVHNKAGKRLVVGFNRRFSPFAVKMKEQVSGGRLNIVATMNAGFIPADVWVHDPDIGGGRILGEACHFFDLCSFLTGSRIISVCTNALGPDPDIRTDNVSITLKYEDGSNATVHYFSNGSKRYPKERIEVHSQQKTLYIDNWRKLLGFGLKGFKKYKSRQDKGHANQFGKLYQSLNNGEEAIIPFSDIVNTTRASFAALDSLRYGKWIDVE